MALLVTIGVVVLLIAVRLAAPPVPGLIKMSLEKWGKQSTLILCVAAVVGAVLLILVTRRL